MNDEGVAIALERGHALVLSQRNAEMPHDGAVIRERITPRRFFRRDDERKISERQLLGRREKTGVGRVVRNRADNHVLFDDDRTQSRALRRDRRGKPAWSASNYQQIEFFLLVHRSSCRVGSLATRWRTFPRPTS